VDTAEIALLVSGVVGAVTIVLGVLGAIHARSVHVWQRGRDKERRRVRVHLEIMQPLQVRRVEDSEAATLGADLTWEQTISVAAVNASEESAVYIRDLGVFVTDTRHGYGLLEGDDVRLEPGQRVVRTVVLDHSELADYQRGFTAHATLSTGDTIEEHDRIADDPIRAVGEAARQLQARRDHVPPIDAPPST
jgi:hypothetical protein